MLEKLTIKGFKSIQELNDFELKPINVLIGANGAGKSNFIDFFRMLRAMLEFDIAELQEPSLVAFIEDKGGMANLLFNGPKTKQIKAELIFNEGKNGYSFDLDITTAAGFLINNEMCFYSDARAGQEWWLLGSGYTRPKLLSQEKYRNGNETRYGYIDRIIRSWQIYHFHDTSRLAGVRMPCNITENKYFKFDASNLAAFLYALKEGDFGAKPQTTFSEDGEIKRELIPNQDAIDSYEQIVETVKVIAPYFEDFILTPPKEGMTDIKLQWKQKGSSLDMQSYHLSDGTLRFICIATALLQPNPPGLMLIDEPELGLHPEALAVLAELIELSKDRTQFILSTQSPAFADLFKPEDIVTVKRKDGATTFERLNPDNLKGWIDDFSVGQLWRKNVIKGGIVNE